MNVLYNYIWTGAKKPSLIDSYYQIYGGSSIYAFNANCSHLGIYVRVGDLMADDSRVDDGDKKHKT